MSAGRARRATCIVVIVNSACDQAPRGRAWLGHLHAHVQSMMSWRLRGLLQSTVHHLLKSNKSPSFQFHPTFHSQLDLTTDYFVNCELFSDCEEKASGLKPFYGIFVRRNVRDRLEKPLKERALNVLENYGVLQELSVFKDERWNTSSPAWKTVLTNELLSFLQKNNRQTPPSSSIENGIWLW